MHLDLFLALTSYIILKKYLVLLFSKPQTCIPFGDESFVFVFQPVPKELSHTNGKWA
jgi:hypothetical protein